MKLCAYHLCGNPLDREHPQAKYCGPRCRSNANQWNWRRRKPKKRATQQRRTGKRQVRARVKRWRLAKKAPLLARSLKAEKRAAQNEESTPI